MKASTILNLSCIFFGATNAWVPNVDKIRGVNLGSLFIVEPWMMSKAWSDMGCSGQESEVDCVKALGQDAANSAFQGHWSSWINETDFVLMAQYGLNTVRIPLGYWIVEDLVYRDSEYFPEGGFAYLEQVVGWAKDNNINVILDLHGAPGAQEPNQPFTGNYTATPGFYQDSEYQRAYKFLENITNTVHSNEAFSTVFAIEVVNEPLQDASQTTSMINDYYPTAYNTIREEEESQSISSDDQLHVMFMDKSWGSGDPTSALPSGYTNAFGDSHDYVKYTSGIQQTMSAYLSYSCQDNRTGSLQGYENGVLDTIVGEWSLSVDDTLGADTTTYKGWYADWFKAQVQTYENNTRGWIFWSWKTQLNDYRWSYQDAVNAYVIPETAGTIASTANVC